MASVPRWVYAVAIGGGLLAFGTYYIIQDDIRVKQHNKLKAAEKQAMRLMHQINADRLTVEEDMSKITSSTEAYTEKEREYKIAYCNEMFLRLMERVDAIQPRAVIMEEAGQDRPPTEFEQQLITTLKQQKKKLTRKIQAGFDRVDRYKNDLKN